jgi:hypothetical protein
MPELDEHQVSCGAGAKAAAKTARLQSTQKHPMIAMRRPCYRVDEAVWGSGVRIEAPRPVSLRTSFRRSKRSGEVSPDKLTMLLSTFATLSLREIYGAIRPNKKSQRSELLGTTDRPRS